MEKDKSMSTLRKDFENKEEFYNLRISELNQKIDEKTNLNLLLAEKCDKLEKEIMELREKLSLSNEFSSKYRGETELNRVDYLEKKFSISKYEEKYIIKCLQKDLLDFQEYTKDQ